MKRFAALLFALFSALVAPSIQAQTSYEGMEMCLDPDEAPAFVIRACTRVLESDGLSGSELWNVLASRAWAHYRVQDFAQAIVDCNQLILRFPDQASVYLVRGYAYQSLNDSDLAVADFTVAIMLNPNLEAAYMARGIEYLGQEVFDRAIFDFGEVIRVNPQSGDAYYNRGLAYFLTGDFVRAIADLDRADPDAMTLYVRGHARLKLHEDAAARADIAAARALDPRVGDIFPGISSETRVPPPRATAAPAQGESPVPASDGGNESRDQVISLLFIGGGLLLVIFAFYFSRSRQSKINDHGAVDRPEHDFGAKVESEAVPSTTPSPMANLALGPVLARKLAASTTPSPITIQVPAITWPVVVAAGVFGYWAWLGFPHPQLFLSGWVEQKCRDLVFEKGSEIGYESVDRIDVNASFITKGRRLVYLEITAQDEREQRLCVMDSRRVRIVSRFEEMLWE